MGTHSLSKVERLAKGSRTLGILSVAVLTVAGLILIYARFFLDGVDWVSGIGYVIFALFLLLVSLLLGITAVITARIALKRNREEGNDQRIERTANLGQALGLACSLLILVFLGVTWWLSSNTPPPDISTPMPSTTVP